MLISLASLLNGKEIKEHRETFTAIDVDSSGGITREELKNAYRQAGQVCTTEEAGDIISRVDFDHNGEITLSEFISGTLDHHMTTENLYKVFRFFCPSSSASELSLADLKKAFERRAIPRMKEESAIKDMLEEAGVHEDEAISFPRFCELMGVQCTT